MNPTQTIDDILKELKTNSESCNNTDKVYTEMDLNKRLTAIANTISAVLTNSDFELSMISVENKEITVDGMLCKASELENIIVLQALSFITESDSEILMHYVQELSKKGEFNSKSVLLLPYDIRILKSKLAK